MKEDKILNNFDDSLKINLDIVIGLVEEDILKIKKQIIVKEETLKFLKKYFEEINNV